MFLLFLLAIFVTFPFSLSNTFLHFSVSKASSRSLFKKTQMARRTSNSFHSTWLLWGSLGYYAGNHSRKGPLVWCKVFRRKVAFNTGDGRGKEMSEVSGSIITADCLAACIIGDQCIGKEKSTVV